MLYSLTWASYHPSPLNKIQYLQKIEIQKYQVSSGRIKTQTISLKYDFGIETIYRKMIEQGFVNYSGLW